MAFLTGALAKNQWWKYVWLAKVSLLVNAQQFIMLNQGLVLNMVMDNTNFFRKTQ